MSAAGADPGITEIAAVIADAHHRFQWIHPFQDTNGRTGRVLDAYFLWVTFGLVGADLSTSPVIEPFPTETDEDDCYVGLQDADNGSPDRLRRYYANRIVAAFQALAKPSVPPPPGSTPVPNAK